MNTGIRIIGGFAILAVITILWAANDAHAESGNYDPGRDKGFQINDARFIAALNRDSFLRSLRIKVRVKTSELANDQKRDVLEYDFGGCPQAVGSVDHKSRNVLSFGLTAGPDCIDEHAERFLLASAAAVRALGAAISDREAKSLISRLFERFKATF
jgi:hypothetical protein